VPCRLGSEKVVNVPAAARGGKDAGHVAMIRELAEAMAAASICGRGQAALVDVALWDDFERWHAGCEWGSGKADN
jgi:NADH:ubiquinone oxidoreductase subunit F (NADH-binding)